jgi:hypothetical protein
MVMTRKGKKKCHLVMQSIGVMAIDNLPCELPRDASESFGRDLLNNVIPRLLLDDEEESDWSCHPN